MVGHAARLLGSNTSRCAEVSKVTAGHEAESWGRTGGREELLLELGLAVGGVVAGL